MKKQTKPAPRPARGPPQPPSIYTAMFFCAAFYALTQYVLFSMFDFMPRFFLWGPYWGWTIWTIFEFIRFYIALHIFRSVAV